jgi:O-methyltransferase
MAQASQIYTDLTPNETALVNFVRPFTMTSVERIITLSRAVVYLKDAGIPGAFVECGVWRGGSMMAAARTLLERGDTSRDIYMFDTYEGMPAPTEQDSDNAGNSASSMIEKEERRLTPQERLNSALIAYSPLKAVQDNMLSTGYPASRIHLIKGPVEETLPRNAPDHISLLRLDTDWYESTKHELHTLYPRVSAGGIVIIDDYGHWSGAKKAVDDYFATRGISIFLNRIDYTGRCFVKP